MQRVNLSPFPHSPSISLHPGCKDAASCATLLATNQRWCSTKCECDRLKSNLRVTPKQSLTSSGPRREHEAGHPRRAQSSWLKVRNLSGQNMTLRFFQHQYDYYSKLGRSRFILLDRFSTWAGAKLVLIGPEAVSGRDHVLLSHQDPSAIGEHSSI